jgi:hypothetical protein
MSDVIKVPLELAITEFDTLNYLGKPIKVKPYLSLPAQEEIIRIYLDQYFEPSVVVGTNRDCLSAEVVLMLAVIDECTDIKVFEDDGVTPFIKLDALLCNIQLWDAIRGKIQNYYDFRESLNKFIKMMEDERSHEQSLAAVVDNFLGDISEVLGKLSKMDISQDGFNKLQEIVKSVSESKLLSPNTKEKKPRKSSKKEILQ